MSNTNPTYKNYKDALKRGSYVLNSLLERGISKKDAAAIMGNLYVESNFNVRAEGDLNTSSTAIGLAQWRKDRKANLLSRYEDPYSIDSQIDYLIYELQTPTSGGWGQSKIDTFFDEDKSVEEKTEYMMTHWERPSKNPEVNHIAKRKGFSQFVYNSITEGEEKEPDYNIIVDNQKIQPKVDNTRVELSQGYQLYNQEVEDLIKKRNDTSPPMIVENPPFDLSNLSLYQEPPSTNSEQQKEPNKKQEQEQNNSNFLNFFQQYLTNTPNLIKPE